MTIKVTIEGKEYGLTFGMIAVEEMQLRQAANIQSDVTIGNARALTDMFFCGYNNYADNNAINRIGYGVASELVETLLYSNDVETQNNIVSAFQNCRATQALVSKFDTESADKKKAEALTTTE